MSFFPSFSNPLAFLGLLGIGVLYYAYRKAKSSNKKEIPSLFFIKQLELPKQAHKSKKLPLRFYLESLFVLLLVLYLANPEMPRAGKRVAIVLDRSMSMGVVNSQGVARYKEASDLFFERLEKKSSANEYVLYQLPLFLNRDIVNFADIETFETKDEIKKRISSMEPVSFTDGLEQAIPELAEHLVRNKFDELFIISDKLVHGSPHESLTLKSVSVGSSENNLYLISARTRIETGASVALDIAYGFSGSGSTSVTFEVKEISPNETVLEKRQSVIQGGSEKIETVLLGGNLHKRNAILQIEAKISPVRDSLEVDNELYLVHAPEIIESPVVFISPDTKRDKKIRESLEVALQKNLMHLGCKNVDAFLEKNSRKNSLYIYYKCPAPEVLYGNTLVVLPSQSSALLPIKEVKTKPQITSWNSAHEITRYLKLSILSLPNGVLFNQIPWGSAVISASEGALLLAGSSEGMKLVVSGIELLPFEGSRNKVGSILLLNIFAALQSLSDETGRNTYTRDQFSELQQLTPSRMKKEEEFSLLESGIYKGVFKESGKKTVFNVQNFYPEESDTWTKIKHSFGEEPIVISEDVAASYARYLLFAGIGVLLLDLLLIAMFRREV